MEVLYSLNVLVAIALLLWPLWFSTRCVGLTAVNPLTIAMALGLPVQLFKLIGGPLVLIDGGLADSGYQFAVLMSNLQIICETASLVFFYQLFARVRVERALPLRRVTLSRRDARRAEYVFLALFAACYLLLALGEFGLGAWLANPREGYQFHRSGAGQWYALATTFLGVAFLLSFISRPTPGAVVLNMLLYVFLGYFLGSKGTLLTIFTSGVVYLWFIRWRHLHKFIAFGLPLIFALLLVNLFLAMADGFGISAVLEYFDYFKNAADYYDAYFTGQIHLFHGDVLLSSVWAYVPRAVWPDKPYVYGVLLVNEFFYPGQAELTNTPAFGGAVEQFADFGVIGVVAFGLFSLQSLITAALAYLSFRRPAIDVSRMTLGTALVMLVQFAPMFGAYFPGALVLVLLGFVLLVLIATRSRRRRARSAADAKRAPPDGAPSLPA